MATQGWISLHRSIMDDTDWTNETFTRSQAWIDLLLLANYKDTFTRISGERFNVKRGELIWSQKSLSARWKWSRGKVKRYLDELQDLEHQIEYQNIRRSTLIKIVNYDKHQTLGSAPNYTPDNIPNRLQTEHQTDIDNKDNNINNDNNVNNISPKSPPGGGTGQESRSIAVNDCIEDIEYSFNQIWEQYPKKLGRRIALQHFKASVKTSDQYQKIQTALRTYCEYRQNKDPRFTQQGSNWFNNWQDWVDFKMPRPISPQRSSLTRKSQMTLDAVQNIIKRHQISPEKITEG